MIKTGLDVSRALEGNNRLFSCSINIDFLSLHRDTAVRLFAPNAAAGSIPEQITETGACVRDRLFIGTSLKNRLFPSTENLYGDGLWHEKRTLKKPRVGYIGKKADLDGSNDDIVSVRFSRRSVSFISIETDPKRIIIDANITASDASGKILFTGLLRGNSSASVRLPCKVERAASISIHITKSTLNKRIWLLTFIPSLQMTFSDDDIVNVKHSIKKSQNKEATIGRVYLQNIDIELFNDSRQFDFLNTDSPLFGALKKNIELNVSFSLAATPFTFTPGRFYVDSWESSEEKATITVKAVDYLASIKDDEIASIITENKTAATLFNALARSCGLENNDIDSSLENIPLPLFVLSGKVGTAFNDLCEISQAICMINVASDGIVVCRMTQLRGNSRYPLRYLTTDEYIKTDSHKTENANPNMLTVEYQLAEYEQNEVIDKKQEKVIMYSTLPVRTFPPRYIGIPPYNRPVGADEAPSAEYTFTLDEDYLRTELSDSFDAQFFEYTIIEDRQNNTVTVIIWLFEQRDESEQFTIAPIIKAKNNSILLQEESYTVPAKPDNYVSQISDTADTETRNQYNEAAEFEVKLSGKISIDYVVPGNIQKPGQFEYTVRQTAAGCIIRVWNYLPYEQQFSVSVYGKRIKDAENKKIITIKNDDEILKAGLIKKTISLKGLASDAVAFSLARSSASFYQTFRSSQSFEPWSDPRFQIGDCIAYESLRGYGYTQGIIEEINLTYTGCLSQKVKLLHSEKHNRNGTVFSGYALGDRPVMSSKTQGYV